ncbi:hypothetical protein [Hafnia alvei]|uniref:Uncharacterized protein n=1 Tax=Hafnia alvei TaxID=569 RepID=A0ABD7Q7I1_HAFAL|nr:hypothetical protein [Hafnia alvei]TBL66701.1 hypothetical protein EYY96_17175 [Hafnia alvei]
MKSHFVNGCYRLVDTINEDTLYSSINTDKSNHLVIGYISGNDSTDFTAFGKIVTNTGIMPQPFRLSNNSENAQSNVCLTRISATDSFVAVWDEQTDENEKNIFIRYFSLSANGTLQAQQAAQKISNSAGVNVAPRIIYNHANGLFFVTWFSMLNKSIQMQYLSFDEAANTFKDTSYISELEDTVDAEFFADDLNLHTSTRLNLCLTQAEGNDIISVNIDDHSVGFYECTCSNSKITQTKLLEYQTTDIKKFTTAYDSFNKKLKIVYTLEYAVDEEATVLYSDVYGDSISYFPGKKMMAKVGAERLELNLANHKTSFPVIESFTCTTADISDIRFIIAWKTDDNGVSFNEFSSDFIPLTVESNVSSASVSASAPSVTVTNNQKGVIFSAAGIGSSALYKSAILMAVETLSANSLSQ